MPVLTRRPPTWRHLPLTKTSFPTPAPTRAFASLANHDHPIPSLNGFRPSNATAAILTATAADHKRHWAAWWHLPDVNIEERAARLSHTLSRLQGQIISGGIFVAISGEVKGNPTESEADVAADRSDDDPLPPEKHHTIQLPAGELEPKPTPAEANVRADRAPDDPLPKARKQ